MEKKHVDNNVLSSKPTKFLAGVELIKNGREEFNFTSENWTFPIFHYGSEDLQYYAEVWEDGMDYNAGYWLVESVKLDSPKVIPFLFFDNIDERNDFNDYDFKILLKALLWKRYDQLLNDSKNPKNYFSDQFWVYLEYMDSIRIFGNTQMNKCLFQHASQIEVSFWVNAEFLIKK